MNLNKRKKLTNIGLQVLSILILVSYYLYVILESEHYTRVTSFTLTYEAIPSYTFWFFLVFSALGVLILISSFFINNEKLNKVGHSFIFLSYLATLTRCCFFILVLKENPINLYITDIIFIFIFILLLNIEMFIYKKNKVVDAKYI